METAHAVSVVTRNRPVRPVPASWYTLKAV